MKFFNLKNRVSKPSTVIPHVRVGVAHLTGPGKLTSANVHLVFETSETRQIRLDVDGLSEILAYGELQLSSGAMKIIEDQKIALTWLSPNGCTVLGSLAHNHSDRVLTRLLQFQAWEDRQWQLIAARYVVRKKIDSIHSAMRHYQRQGRTLGTGTLKQIVELEAKCVAAASVDELRGFEGYASSLWFAEYSSFFKSEWRFKTRNRRPPKDPVNSLLSLAYMQLLRRIAARIESRGYEVGLGALHEFRPGRASMACDIMEPLRVPVVDRWVMAMCHQGLVKLSDFETQENGAVFLVKQSLGKVLSRFEEHWNQGNFSAIIDQHTEHWINTIRENVSLKTSRSAAYLKQRVLVESSSSASGKLQVE